MKAQSRSRNGSSNRRTVAAPKTPQPAMMPPKLYREDTRETATSPGYSLRVYEVRKVSPVTVTVCSPNFRKKLFVNTRSMTAVMSSVWWQPAPKQVWGAHQFITLPGWLRVSGGVREKFSNPLSTHLLLVGSD